MDQREAMRLQNNKTFQYADKKEFPIYSGDLRHQYQSELRRGDKLVSAISSQKWDDIVRLQDDNKRVEVMVEDSLKGAYSGLNPMFDIGIDVLNRKVQKQTADSKSRMKMV